MNKKLYEKIKKDYGEYASWAIWGVPLSDLNDYDEISDKIRPNIVIVGLNVSIEISPNEIKTRFENFHIPEDKNKESKMHWRSKKNIEKLEHAFGGSDFKGAYMTDIIIIKNTIKGLKLSNSYEVMAYLRKNPKVESENIKRFKKELDDIKEAIGSDDLLIIALGCAVHEILLRNKEHFENFNIIPVKHYSANGNKYSYKKEVLDTIESYRKLKGIEEEDFFH